MSKTQMTEFTCDMCDKITSTRLICGITAPKYPDGWSNNSNGDFCSVDCSQLYVIMNTAVDKKIKEIKKQFKSMFIEFARGEKKIPTCAKCGDKIPILPHIGSDELYYCSTCFAARNEQHDWSKTPPFPT